MVFDPVLDPEGVEIVRGLSRWNGRPVGILEAGRALSSDAKKLQRKLDKHPRTEVAHLSEEDAAGAQLVAAESRALRHALQMTLGSLMRPEFDGVPDHMSARESSGPGHIVATQSN